MPAPLNRRWRKADEARGLMRLLTSGRTLLLCALAALAVLVPAVIYAQSQGDIEHLTLDDVSDETIGIAPAKPAKPPENARSAEPSPPAEPSKPVEPSRPAETSRAPADWRVINGRRRRGGSTSPCPRIN